MRKGAGKEAAISGIKIDKKILIYAIAAIAILAIIIWMFYSPKLYSSSGSAELNTGSFEYAGYDIQNESLIKANCAAIRVYHCEVFGEIFGPECPFRPVDIKYKLIGISADDLVCEASEVSVTKVTQLGTSEFTKTAEEGIWALTYKMDIRKANEIDICCKPAESSEGTAVANASSICLPTMQVNAVCMS